MPLSESVWKILICPSCAGALTSSTPDEAVCTGCGTHYSRSAPGKPLDLRLRTPRDYTITFDLHSSLMPQEGLRFGPLVANENPEIQDYRDIPIPPLLRSGNRLNHELLSYFPRAKQDGGLMLDLGCGYKEFEEICRHTNLQYVGMDYSGEAPDLLGDAHALPFADGAFDFIVSFAVLEHLRFPFVAMAEALRVLKPGGLFVGTVAFLEPFHMDSYAHLTHLGTYNVLTQAGFDVQVVAPNVEWSALHALASMILFPRLPKALCDLMILPTWLLHRLWWKLGHMIDPKPRTSEAYRLPATTGGFRFVALRPVVPLASAKETSYSSAISRQPTEREPAAQHAVHTNEA